MSEGKEGLLGYDNLRDFLEGVVGADDDWYDRQVLHLTQLAGKFGITPLQMGQLDESLVWIDYEMKADDNERQPYVELVHTVAGEIGDKKTKEIIQDWLSRRVEGFESIVPVAKFSEATTINQALLQVREVTRIIHGVGVDAAVGFLSGIFENVEEINPLKKDQPNN